MMVWRANQFFAVIFLVWLLVLFVQSLLGLFRVRLATAQLFGLILVICGVLWILYVLPNSPLQRLCSPLCPPRSLVSTGWATHYLWCKVT